MPLHVTKMEKNMTTLLYYDPIHTLSAEAKVITTGHDNTGGWIELDQTVFHVQGGGQPSDRGIMNQSQVIDVRRVDHQVRHYIEDKLPDIGTTVDLKVDQERRQHLSAWHTAGHLLAAILEQCIPGLVIDRTDQRPEAAWVSGHWEQSIQTEVIAEMIQQTSNALIASDLPITIINDAERLVMIGAFAPVPCGGTHLCRTGQLAGLNILKMRVKKGILKVSYDATLAN